MKRKQQQVQKGVGARQTATQVPTAATQPSPPASSRQLQRAGGKAATVAQAPPAATSLAQKGVAQAMHGPQPRTDA
ncbi:hypothetical protein TYRP_020265 [Tyrophagus putrescentiae]|nr:hypothetical protein TYRP_020265 [Tyrophagus putrescentiae]